MSQEIPQKKNAVNPALIERLAMLAAALEKKPEGSKPETKKESSNEISALKIPQFVQQTSQPNPPPMAPSGPPMQRGGSLPPPPPRGGPIPKKFRGAPITPGNRPSLENTPTIPQSSSEPKKQNSSGPAITLDQIGQVKLRSSQRFGEKSQAEKPADNSDQPKMQFTLRNRGTQPENQTRVTGPFPNLKLSELKARGGKNSTSITPSHPSGLPTAQAPKNWHAVAIPTIDLLETITSTSPREKPRPLTEAEKPLSPRKVSLLPEESMQEDSQNPKLLKQTEPCLVDSSLWMVSKVDGTFSICKGNKQISATDIETLSTAECKILANKIKETYQLNFLPGIKFLLPDLLIFEFNRVENLSSIISPWRSAYSAILCASEDTTLISIQNQGNAADQIKSFVAQHKGDFNQLLDESELKIPQDKNEAVLPFFIVDNDFLQQTIKKTYTLSHLPLVTLENSHVLSIKLSKEEGNLDIITKGAIRKYFPAPEKPEGSIVKSEEGITIYIRNHDGNLKQIEYFVTDHGGEIKLKNNNENSSSTRAAQVGKQGIINKMTQDEKKQKSGTAKKEDISLPSDKENCLLM